MTLLTGLCSVNVLLLKVVKTCSAEEFAQHIEKKDFPKLRMGPAESKIKENFWNDCLQIFKARGILQPSVAVKERIEEEKKAA